MVKIELSYRGIIVAGLGILTLWLLLQLWPVVLLVITSFIFMTSLLPYADWLTRHRIPRVAAVLLILFAIVAILVGLFSLVVPAMVDEFRNLRDNLPAYARDLQNLLKDLGINVDLEDRARNIDWTQVVSGRAAVNYGQKVFFWLVSSVTVIVLTAYLLIEAPNLSRFLYGLVPPARQADAGVVLQGLNRVVGGYIRGQVITSVIIAVYTLIVLLAAGVPNPIAFAVLAGFADIVPLVGAFISVAPASVAAFQESSTQALIVLVLLILYQQFEDRFLVPRVYGRTLNLPPVVVLIAVLAGGELLGVPGVLLALPATAAGRVGLDFWLERHHPFGHEPLPQDEAFAPDDPVEPEVAG